MKGLRLKDNIDLGGKELRMPTMTTSRQMKMTDEEMMATSQTRGSFLLNLEKWEDCTSIGIPISRGRMMPTSWMAAV